MKAGVLAELWGWCDPPHVPLWYLGLKWNRLMGAHGSCHCAPVCVQGRRMVKPHTVIHTRPEFGEPCLGTERSSLLLL